MNNMTQMAAAKQGIITEQMNIVAQKEGLDPQIIRERVAAGTIAIPANKNHHSLNPNGVGLGLKTKVNVNLGVSSDCANYQMELEKVELALENDVEAIMDLSNYGKTYEFREKLIEMSTAMIGTVPIYDAIGYFDKDLKDLRAEDFLEILERHAQQGVDFVTIHAGITQKVAADFRKSQRITNIVSRGGSLLFAWMAMTGNENPFYEYYDEVLDILARYDVTISLGDALRPGCLHDASDAGQIGELIELSLLIKRAWAKNVQVIVEGPGHMAIDEIAANMKIQKRLCHDAPFYVLGPIVTDIAPGYDHITSAIGGALAASCGADFLCYVTPAEHLRLPDVSDVKEGIMAVKIAAHAADIAKKIPGARDIDDKMARARNKVDWDGMFDCALDPKKARDYYNSIPASQQKTCSMCGKMCAMRTTNMILDGENVDIY